MDPQSPADPTAARPAARRTLLAGAGVAAGVAAAASLAGPADAAESRTTRLHRATRYEGTRLLSPAARHLVTRFSYGVTPALARQVRAHGGAHQWFEWQLEPSRIHDPAAANLVSWYPGLDWSPQKLWAKTQDGSMPFWQVMQAYQAWLLVRRIRSQRQLLELMTEFWENHFNVPVMADGVFSWRKRYGDMLRANALTSFENLLQKASVHPAMGIFLGNAVSDKTHPNENQGRELLELHTVGVGNYTENDVKSSARILTGYQVDEWNTWTAGYNELAHWTGPVSVGTFHASNGSANGRPVTQAYLHYLAHHPDTAQRIATKLATVFVRDDPPASLVDHLAKVYLQHGTQIRPVLQALVSSSAFAHSVDAKVRDPEADVVATYRALDVSFTEPAGPATGPYEILWQASSVGSEPMSWPRPDGRPIDDVSWASPSRLLGSMGLHYSMAGGWWPVKNTRFHHPVDWLPAPQVRFDHFVDHLSQLVLHRHSTDRLLTACAQAVGAKPHDVVDKHSGVITWLFPRLMTTLLDSPDFYRK